MTEGDYKRMWENNGIREIRQKVKVVNFEDPFKNTESRMDNCD